MSENRRKTVALGAAALMALSGLTTGVATASAQPNTENCVTSRTVDHDWLGVLGTTYSVNKEVVGDGTAAPGGEVTFRTTVTGAGALINRIQDFHPEGFELVSARHSVWYLLGGQKWTTVTNDVSRNSTNNSVTLTSSGWTTAGNARVTLETTYRVPRDASAGNVFNTGAAFRVAAVANGNRVDNPIDVCVTIREPNAVEAATGSLNDLGLGSVTSGSTTAGGISSDPATFSSDIINGIDIGQLIGLS
ncbi:hypothetical protein ACWGLC_08980 [Dietzia sp. NPDC055877]